MNYHRLTLKFVILLIITSNYGITKHVEKKSCDGVHVNGKFHRKELIANGIDRPYQLSTFEKSFYFSYNVGNDTEDKFEIGHFKNNEMKPLSSIKNGFAIAIDHKNKVAYFGGSNGIYEKDLDKSTEVKHVIKDKNIWDMFFHHHLYFIAFPSLRLYKKIGNDSEIVEHVQEKIYHFAIDGYEDTFIAGKDGLYEIKNGTKEKILYEEPKIFRAIEIDREGKAYFCGQHGIYVADKHNHTLIEIASIKNIFGLTFDVDNNIVYSDPHEIIRLVPGDCK